MSVLSLYIPHVMKCGIALGSLGTFSVMALFIEAVKIFIFASRPYQKERILFSLASLIKESATCHLLHGITTKFCCILS